jgi:gamma-glutamyltranspeptidase/glutathione hydrolase
MVVCQEPRATEAGVRILERGGNAADAAVAVALALAVVLPQAGNLGGGGFALWVGHDPANGPRFLDFRETAPRGLRPEHFLDEGGQRVPSRSLESGLAVGVPGSPRGLFEFHRVLGRLPFAEVAAPAIALAREGFEVGPELAAELVEEQAELLASPGSRALFLAGETPLAAGTRLQQPDLARTLERLAREGPDAFYLGDVAEKIVVEVQAAEGVLTLSDLAGYEPLWRAPLVGWFRGHEIITAPPPSSGGVALLQVLALLDGFPLDEERVRVRAEEPSDPVGLSRRTLHWWVECMRLAFADRAEHLGDPAFHRVPLEALLSSERINALRVGIGEMANPRVRSAPTATEGGETTHLSVLDPEGNAVALTTTLNTSFGSGILARGTGVLLNDEIDDFAIVAGSPNAYGLVGGAANALEPLKRPLSSMTPTVVRESGQVVRLVLGSPGGPRIITSVLGVLLRTIVFGQEIRAAVAAPRIHQQWSPSVTQVEPGWDELLLQGLKDKGHGLEPDAPWGSVQAIAVEVGGEPVGASDPRSGGSAQRAVRKNRAR